MKYHLVRNFLCLLIATVLYASPAFSIDFKIGGFWTMAFGVGDTGLTSKRDGQHVNNGDEFTARQRLTLILRAIASENLEGLVAFKMSPQVWGSSATGGALGADGNVVKIAQSYVQWAVPNSDLKLKMGLQFVTLPNAAGGTAIHDNRVAATVANYKISDQIGITALWMRLLNDNYGGGDFRADQATGIRSKDGQNFLDNMDLFFLSVPMTFDGIKLEPWAMYGIQGRNAAYFDTYYDNWFADGAPAVATTPFLARLEGGDGLNIRNLNPTSKPYGNMFWLGLPVTISEWDPLNIEFDFNYGFVESMGRFDVATRNNWNDVRRGSMQRQGWLAKALIEYKMDWGTPGIFGWYASGDDGNVKNGSERLPSLCAYGNFTSFMGYGQGLSWESSWFLRAKTLSYAGTWGIGAQLKDVSFIDNLKHTLRVAYWGGTNSPSMVKYMTHSNAWESPTNRYDSLYLTTNDGLLEFNFLTNWQIYDNLECVAELGYIANFMDDATWKKDYSGFGSYQKQDAWKAQVYFQYTF